MPTSPNFYGAFHGRRAGGYEAERVAEAEASLDAPAEYLQELAAPLTQITRFPPREGYGDIDMRTPTIASVLAQDRWYPDNRNDFSGFPAGDFGGRLQENPF